MNDKREIPTPLIYDNCNFVSFRYHLVTFAVCDFHQDIPVSTQVAKSMYISNIQSYFCVLFNVKDLQVTYSSKAPWCELKVNREPGLLRYHHANSVSWAEI